MEIMNSAWSHLQLAVEYGKGHKFGPGITVGCGINFTGEAYFFTLEGKIVDTLHVSAREISHVEV